jgi:hypothetical protein
VQFTRLLWRFFYLRMLVCFGTWGFSAVTLAFKPLSRCNSTCDPGKLEDSPKQHRTSQKTSELLEIGGQRW